MVVRCGARKLEKKEELRQTKSSLSLHDQYRNTDTDAAKWNPAKINYMTRISAFRTVEAFVLNLSMLDMI